MEKIASLVKTAEVRGVMACLVDSDLVKVANAEDFDALTEAVSENLSEDYNLDEVLNKTAEILDAVEAEAGSGEQEKEASNEDITEADVYAAYGELSMMKEAGEISEEDFEKEAASLQDLVQGAKNLGGKAYGGDVAQVAKSFGSKAKAAPSKYKDALLGKGSKGAKQNLQYGKKNLSDDVGSVSEAQKKLDAAKNFPNRSNKDAQGLLNQIKSKRGTELSQAQGRAKQTEQGVQDLKSQLGKIRKRQATAAGGTAAAAGGAGYGIRQMLRDDEQ